jgi:hypothetical protein
MLITHQIREYAERLLRDEGESHGTNTGSVPVSFRVCDNLRRPLTTLAGAAGFHSLLSRALTLAKRDAPGLQSLRVRPDGSLDSANFSEESYEAADGVILVAYLIGLLFTFVGDTLTLRLLHEVWPQGSFNTFISEGTGTHDSQE